MGTPRRRPLSNLVAADPRGLCFGTHVTVARVPLTCSAPRTCLETRQRVDLAPPPAPARPVQGPKRWPRWRAKALADAPWIDEVSQRDEGRAGPTRVCPSQATRAPISRTARTSACGCATGSPASAWRARSRRAAAACRGSAARRRAPPARSGSSRSRGRRAPARRSRPRCRPTGSGAPGVPAPSPRRWRGSRGSCRTRPRTGRRPAARRRRSSSCDECARAAAAAPARGRLGAAGPIRTPRTRGLAPEAEAPRARSPRRRDRRVTRPCTSAAPGGRPGRAVAPRARPYSCLLYTSDAADEL